MYKIMRKLLFLLSPEKAHAFTLIALATLNKIGLLKLLKPTDHGNSLEVMGITFPNRVGLAAGLDKNGECIEGLSNLGFGFVEIGTVTPRPQAGNPTPRLFRLPEAHAIINRMGFNNQGIDYLLEQVNDARDAGFDGIIGINIGKNFDTAIEDATEDYLIGLRKAYAYADYITVNISSPNTPGLRDLQYGKELSKLLAALKNEQIKLVGDYRVYKPIAIKVAPDLSEDEVKDIAESLLDNKMDALIATNTTLSREAVTGMMYADEAGGLSGTPVREMSTEVIRQFHEILKDRVPIIGVGGISSAKDAQDKIDAGAALIQVYSGLVYEGPGLIKKLLRDL